MTVEPVIKSPEELEHENAKQLAQTFYCRHMEPGICGYGDDERVYLDLDTLKRMAPTLVNKPIYVGHNPAVGKFLRGMTSELPDKSDGYVTECFFNPLDGWLWAKMLVTSDLGMQKVKEGWSVSNAYLPKEISGGRGEYHAVDYDRKISNAVFTHLAIVPDPRYEQAKIFTPDEFRAYQDAKSKELAELQNNKGSRKMFKFFKNERKEITGNEIPEDALVELSNGKTVTLKEMTELVEKDEAAKAEKENAKKKGADPEATVTVGGKSMKVSDLAAKYAELTNGKEKKNSDADDEDKKKKSDDEKDNSDDADDDKKKKGDDEKDNSDDEDDEKKKKAEKEKENAKKKGSGKFDELSNAHLKKGHQRVAVSVDGVQRGKERYGTPAKS